MMCEHKMVRTTQNNHFFDVAPNFPISYILCPSVPSHLQYEAATPCHPDLLETKEFTIIHFQGAEVCRDEMKTIVQV